MTLRMLVLLVGVVTSVTSQSQTPVFRAAAAVVTVPVAVRDGEREVPDLTAADFEVLDNGVPQVISSAALQATPISVTVLLDVSGSVDGTMFERFTQDVRELSSTLTTRDRVRVLTVGTQVIDETGWVEGGNHLALGPRQDGGGTALYNGLVAAMLTARGGDQPHVVIGFSDGLDTVSALDAAAVAQVASRAEAAAFLTLVHAVSPRMMPALVPWTGRVDVRQLRGMLERTGGELTEVGAGTSMAESLRTMLAQFRTMYVLRYTPTGVPSGGWHDITVRLPGRRYTVKARAGYDGG